MIYIFLLYNNLITGNIFIYANEFIEMNKNNLINLINGNSSKTYINLNNTTKKYEYETEIMKYIGYIKFNNDEDIYNIEDEIDAFLNIKEYNLVCLDESYIFTNYINLIKYSKKECLIYKIKLLEYLKIYNKLTKEIKEKIYLKLINKYYKLNITNNYLNTYIEIL